MEYTLFFQCVSAPAKTGRGGLKQGASGSLWGRRGYNNRMDHDRLFKELLSNFFVEFVDLFLPDVGAFLDRETALVPLDKEVFTDISVGEKHEADLVMKVKFRGENAFFLVHVENQAKAQPDFPRRMFGYFALLTKKYRLPVYPVVIFSYDAPQRQEPDRFVVAFPNKTVLKFEYTVIQLNRLPWRRFVNQPNPVASALMAKMKMTARDRPRVKLECLRLLARLKLDPARSKLIGGFIDSYLALTAQEMKQYEREMATLQPEEKQMASVLISSWERKGINQGINQGKEELVVRMLRRRFGDVPAPLAERLKNLSSEQLDDLGEALLDFTAPSDLEQWLSQR